MCAKLNPGVVMKLGEDQVRRAVVLRVAGAGGILVSIPLALWRDGMEFGVLLWCTLLSVAAVTVALALVWWSER